MKPRSFPRTQLLEACLLPFALPTQPGLQYELRNKGITSL